MKKRGKVLRDPSVGPGLLMVEGQQYSFPLEGVWKSEVPPKAGLAVDVEFSEDGAVSAITAVPESQIAKEQAEQALAAARAKGGALASTAVARFGMPTLIATAVLIIGWFFMTTVSFDAAFVGKFDFSFWKVLSLINSKNAMEAFSTVGGQGSAGFYGLLAIVALIGPFLAHLWKDKRAALGGLLPLLFMVLVTLMVRSALTPHVSGASDEMVEMARNEIMKQVSIGMGAYVSVLAALYLGFLSVKNFLIAKANG